MPPSPPPRCTAPQAGVGAAKERQPDSRATCLERGAQPSGRRRRQVSAQPKRGNLTAAQPAWNAAPSPAAGANSRAGWTCKLPARVTLLFPRGTRRPAQRPAPTAARVGWTASSPKPYKEQQASKAAAHELRGKPSRQAQVHARATGGGVPHRAAPPRAPDHDIYNARSFLHEQPQSRRRVGAARSQPTPIGAAAHGAHNGETCTRLCPGRFVASRLAPKKACAAHAPTTANY